MEQAQDRDRNLSTTLVCLLGTRDGLFGHLFTEITIQFTLQDGYFRMGEDCGSSVGSTSSRRICDVAPNYWLTASGGTRHH